MSIGAWNRSFYSSIAISFYAASRFGHRRPSPPDHARSCNISHGDTPIDGRRLRGAAPLGIRMRSSINFFTPRVLCVATRDQGKQGAVRSRTETADKASFQKRDFMGRIPSGWTGFRQANKRNSHELFNRNFGCSDGIRPERLRQARSRRGACRGNRSRTARPDRSPRIDRVHGVHGVHGIYGIYRVNRLPR